MTKKSREPWAVMNLAELREATREYDRELPVGHDGLPGRVMSARQRKQWMALRKKLRQR